MLNIFPRSPAFFGVVLHALYQVTRVCEKHNISVEQVGPFTLRLQSPECAVELEVCRIRLLFDLYGLVPKRIGGSAHVYKKVCHAMLADLHL